MFVAITFVLLIVLVVVWHNLPIYTTANVVWPLGLTIFVIFAWWYWSFKAYKLIYTMYNTEYMMIKLLKTELARIKKELNENITNVISLSDKSK